MNKKYIILNTLVWGASLILFVVSFNLGKNIVPTKLNSIEQSLIPTVVITLPDQVVEVGPDLRSYIKSYNVKNEKIIDQIVLAVEESSKEFNISKGVLVGVIAKESGFNHKAVSKKKDMGLSQVNARVWGKTLREEGIIKTKDDLLSPAKNVRAGAYILRQYLDEAHRKRVSNVLRYALTKYNGAELGSTSYYNSVMIKIGEFNNV